MADGLTLKDIVDINMRRCEKWHVGDQPWTAERWITAIVGELGEMANVRKKIFRAEDGSTGILKGETLESLKYEEKKEWADTMLYMLLFAGHMGWDPEEAIRDVFNRKSEQLGFEERL
jgi:NTP pyrophosphatase (non-canonical NTP hydrolase)